MRRLSLQLAVLFASITLLAIACTPAPTPDDDDDLPTAISCAIADEAWTTCAAITGSPTPPPFCASLAAGTIGSDSDWGCIASVLNNSWDCAAGLPSSLDEFGTCINLDPGGDDDDTSGDDDTGDDDDSVPSGPCTDDTSEPNNDLATATPAGSGGTFTACPDDEDFFSITVNSDNYLQVDLTFVDEEGDVELYLTDAADATLDSSTSSSDNESAAFLSDTTATYYIKVSLYSDGGSVVGNTYTMTVTTGTPGVEDCGDTLDNDFDGYTDCADSDCDGNAACLEDCGDGVDNDADGDTDCADSSCAGDQACVCTTDAFEPNNSFDTPKPLTVGNHTGLSVCIGDEDWFSFSTASAISIDMTFSDAEGDVDCKLYDSATYDSSANWNTHLGTTCSTASDNEQSTFDPSTWTAPSTDPAATLSGNYLLRVHLYSDGGSFGNTYALDVSF